MEYMQHEGTAVDLQKLLTLFLPDEFALIYAEDISSSTAEVQGPTTGVGTR